MNEELLKRMSATFTKEELIKMMEFKQFQGKQEYVQQESPKGKVELEEELRQLIHTIGIPPHIKGYDYAMDAIMMVAQDKDAIHSVTKRLYPEVAKRHQTTPSRVERAIRHAVEVAWSRGEANVLESIFGYTVSAEKGKPTNSEFIARLAEEIR